MIRRLIPVLFLGSMFFAAVPALGVIKAPTTLKFFLDSSTVICTATVEKFYPEKSALVLTVEEDLKGKASYRRLPVVVKVNPKAENENYIPPLMKRLGESQRTILFINERGKLAIVFGFTNGSWFHMVGQKTSEEKISWSLISGEPYLRRTFKGTTAEMKDVVVGYLAGKKTPPDVNEKEDPGFGPEFRSQEKSDKNGKSSSSALHAGGGLFGVIPTLGAFGPMAILALLFPTVFGGVLVLFRQWTAFLTVLSINSTLLLLYLWQGTLLRGSWWGGPMALWFVMTLVAFAGTIWAWRRQLHQLSLGNGAVETPRRTESVALLVLTVALGGFSVATWLLSPELIVADFLLFAFAFGLILATIMHVVRGLLFPYSLVPGRSTEGVMLSGILVAHIIIATVRWGGEGGTGTAEASESLHAATVSSSGRTVSKPKLRWQFQTRDSGLFVSSPLPVGEQVYAAAAHPGFRVGTLYCLKEKGEKVNAAWEFIDDGAFKEMISSPCIADGRLYIGEGFHDDPNCKMYCIDAATGNKLWTFQTSSQTESSPTVAAGKVYFGAGNDGIYCLDAKSGAKVWQFPEDPSTGRLLRIGAGPLVANGRVYVGSGTDRNRKDDPGETAMLCLDAQTGKLLWKLPTKLPSWGSPVLVGEGLYFGVGNGDIFTDADTRPAGALYCVDAQSGKEIWQFEVANGVLDRPAVDDTQVYFGCRDSYVYCLDRLTGRVRWKRFLESPVISAPALARVKGIGGTESVIAVATGGKIGCLDPRSGDPQWFYDLTSQRPHLSSAPKVVVHTTPKGADQRLIYFGAGLGGISEGRAVLFCLEDLVE